MLGWNIMLSVECRRMIQEKEDWKKTVRRYLLGFLPQGLILDSNHLCVFPFYMSYCIWSLQVHKIEEIAEVAAMDVGEEIPSIPIPEKQKWLNEHPYVPISTLWATRPNAFCSLSDGIFSCEDTNSPKGRPINVNFTWTYKL